MYIKKYTLYKREYTLFIPKYSIILWYQKQNVCLKCIKSYSLCCTICNSVRQSVFFLRNCCQYQLPDTLISYNAGCCINDNCINHVI